MMNDPVTNELQSFGEVDLSNCDREPIHIPGAIQPHGVLVAARVSDLIVTHVSDNFKSFANVAPADLIGRGISQLFPPQEASQREAALRKVAHAKPVYLFTLRTKYVDRTFDAIAHRSGESLYLELEPTEHSADHSATELYQRVQVASNRINDASCIDDLFRICAEHVRTINGFDRVMIYRFDRQWNGQVVAESRREDLEPFLGLHYPASDIPQQARQLYAKNRLRFIADREYIPARIVPETGPLSATPLDMSYCVLRSVSPIHLEYLRNMGVAASMSISLMKGDQLWGLIACHHYSPRFVPYDVRTACEMLGQLMSYALTGAEEKEFQQYQAELRRVSAQMVANVDKHDHLAVALVDAQPDLLAFVEAEGAAVVMGDDVARIGQTPSHEQIAQLAQWLLQNMDQDVFATDHLHQHFGPALLNSVASGVLAIRVSALQPQLLIWFRTEQVRTVDWAGDPTKSVAKSEGEARLSPRGSFALWKETVRGRSKPWSNVELEAARQLRDAITVQLASRAEKLAAANADLQIAKVEREKTLASERTARTESERLHRMKDEFVATLSHELRTPLNAILGWAQLIGHFDNLTEEVAEGLGVIERNARTQAQMIEDLLDVSRIISGKLSLNLQDAHLPSIVDAAVQTVTPTATAKEVRIEKLVDPLVGVATTGDPGRLQQVVWNLLSNAVKFTPRGGKVQVVLEQIDSHVELSITDTGQGIPADFLPHVFDRFRQADASSTRKHGGLGIGLSIVKNLVELHGGAVRAHSPGLGRGSTFVVSLPIRAAKRVQRSTDRAEVSHAHDPSSALDLGGVRVLAIDDEPDARELVRRILEERGCIVSTAGSVLEALDLIQANAFDVIISDIGMPDIDGFEFVRRLRALEVQQGRPKTPAIALTAYARGEDRRRIILAGYQAHVAKPVESGELVVLIASCVDRL